MAFANYNAFRVGVQTLIESDDTVGSSFSTDTLDMFIALSEARVHNGDGMTAGLRASTMLTPLSQLVTANVATLPADLLQLKDPRFSGKRPLELVSLDHIERLQADSPGLVGGDSHFAAQDAETLTFWPAAQGTLIGKYYARPAPLIDGLHTTFLRYPEVYTYAALFEAALFLGMDSKMRIWESRFRSLLDGANHAEWVRVYGGGTLRMRPA
jgi:hypothetical protein